MDLTQARELKRKLMKVRSGKRPYRVDTLIKLRKFGSLQPGPSLAKRIGQLANPTTHMGEVGWDIAGLGVLAAPSVDNLQAKARARISGDTSADAVKKRTVMNSTAHDLAEVGGLGILAVPGGIHAAKYLMKKGALGAYSFACTLDELCKLGAVTPEQARESLRRYEKLQQDAPTAEQVGRYMAVGAIASPAAGAVRDVIRGDKVFKPGKSNPRLGRLRSAAAHSVGGAIISGGVPIVRHYLDQHAEAKKLRTFIGGDNA